MDMVCTFFLVSALVSEVAELRFCGIREYFNFFNAFDDISILVLLFAFLVRLGVFTADWSSSVEHEEGTYEYAPESPLLAVGLSMSWARVFLSLLQEWPAAFTLIEIIRGFLNRDFMPFIMTIFAILLVFVGAATALYTVFSKRVFPLQFDLPRNFARTGANMLSEGNKTSWRDYQ